MKLHALAMAIFAGLASTLPASTPAPALGQLGLWGDDCSERTTDDLIFRASMRTFDRARQAQKPSQCDWSTDGCTFSPNKPAGFDFRQSCYRHDFGYRNAKAQKRFTKAMRKGIDDNFKKDLYTHCSQYDSHWFRYRVSVRCRRLADLYYMAVRRFGSLDNAGFSVADNSVLHLELDDDIEGQVVPDVLKGHGPDMTEVDAISVA